MLVGKRILLGVTGSIAAYQAVDLIGLLKAELADVRVVMTPAATQFVTPLTLEMISGHPVSVEMFGVRSHASIEHTTLSALADLILIAPATANVIGKLASGIADDLLTTLIMATDRPVVIAPAMNARMWRNPVVQRNVRLLRDAGYRFIEPEYGSMVCGGEGWGRLARLEVIVASAREALGALQPSEASPEAHPSGLPR
jgi:phosphopantothenoylcysteine decarboxylase/phosphopantothenate--cysteine ligase